jgi:hypothetical protein
MHGQQNAKWAYCSDGIELVLPCLVGACKWTLPPRRLLLFCWVVHVNPHLITCDYVRKECYITCRPFPKVLERVDEILLSLIEHVGRIWRQSGAYLRFLEILWLDIWCDKSVNCNWLDTRWQLDPDEVSNVSSTSWIVILVFLRTSSCIRFTFSSLLFVGGCSESSACPAEVTPLLNLETQLRTCVLPILYSPKSTFNL